jgi:RNA polymerase sigma-70 factor (ECF subfamily)
LSSEPIPELPDNETPADSLASREELAAIWLLARRSLPEAQFQALWLRYAEEMELASIAAILRKTGTHVKVLLFRARQTLAGALARRQGTDEAATRHPPEPVGVSNPGAGATPNLLYEKLADTAG